MPIRKLFIILILFFSGGVASPQLVYQVKTDSALITGNSGNAELNLENSTKSVNGFLYNKGNGRTQFKKGLVKLNDSLYIIGADTLNLRASSSVSYFTTPYSAKSVDYTLTATDNTIEVTATGKTITLPTAIGITGRIYTVKLIVNGTSTLATTSSQTIDGATTYPLSQYQSITVQSNGTNWIVISSVKPQGSGYDPDAQAFLTATGITDGTISNAINTLVTSAKTHGWWSLCYAIYPMVGGTANTTKYNLKDPRDLDAAYRIIWNGTPAFDNLGVSTSSASNYGDTKFIDNTSFSYNNSHISFYSVTQNQTNGWDMGFADNISPYNELTLYYNDINNGMLAWFNQMILNTPASTTGWWTVTSNSSNMLLYRNGSVLNTNGAPTSAHTNATCKILAIAPSTAVGQRKCAFATIGQDVSSVASSMYSDIQAFQTSLGR